MAVFRPVDCSLCMATVEQGTEKEKRKHVTGWLEIWLHFQSKIGKTGVVVFDIDDTLVDKRERPLEEVIRLFTTCKDLGFKCAIVTARPEGVANRRDTIRMLHANSVKGWESLYMMPNHITNKTVETISEYKRAARDDIESREHILANLGDSMHDLVRYPLYGELRNLSRCQHHTCAVFFPTMSHGEVSVKLVGHYG